MLNKKSKGLPLPNKKATISENFLRISKDHTDNEAVQTQMVKSYLQMRPKSYGEVYYPSFQIARLTKFITHPVSLFLSIPLGFSLVWIYILGMGKAPILELAKEMLESPDTLKIIPFILGLLVSIAVLFLFEALQHVALSTFYKIYYQTKEISLPYLIGGLIFSAVSIAASGYGAIEIAENVTTVDQTEVNRLDTQIKNLDFQIADAMRSRKATNTKNSDLLLSKDQELAYLRTQQTNIKNERAAVVFEGKAETGKKSTLLFWLAMINEFLIHVATFVIFRYMYMTAKNFKLKNDFFKGHNYLGLDFANVTPALSSQPDNFNGRSTDTNHQENDEPHRAPIADKSVNVFDLIKNKQNANNATGNAAILIQEPKQIKRAKSLVPTKKPRQTVSKTKTKRTGKKFKLSELENYLKIYQGKVLKSGTDKTVQNNKIRVLYIKNALSNFEQQQENGLVYFDVSKALKWHKSNSRLSA